MKKLLIIPTLLFLLTSCDKDNENEMTTLNQKAEIKMQMQGEWSNNYKSVHFYNMAGEIAHKDIDSLYLDVRHTFAGDNMHISHPTSGGKESFTYVVPDSSTTNYVVLFKNNMRGDTYEITTMNDTAMVWQTTVDWAGYRDVNANGDSITVTSRKGVYTYRFKRL
ncbi:hypothetical protein ABID22_003457 [Pontibacter aydingkolensis]|uniref:Lipocalin-like domain-containing protein n=1 Tax=Pontibacter aydingkolensis TaxID=1911536 RepID=A0ABS7CV66_9BACT|nr:hypothetical protein [Pontibacter aydingkolensis]MBW7467581.1 hypothetical protein [Pontibacter aydingkolensis]